MPYNERVGKLKQIEAMRAGRTLVSFFNFDRPSSTPAIPGLSIQFNADAKEALYRVLKESGTGTGKVDLCLYTRGGDINAVWPIVSLVREFDPDFEVLVPFRCHSGGTLVALAAKRIIMGRLSELSPIDPSTGNQFNPTDPANPGARLGIGVEDVLAYRNFVLQQFAASDDLRSDEKHTLQPQDVPPLLKPFLDRLAERVHPLALGNVHRVHQQIQRLARQLLDLHPVQGRDVNKVIRSLTTGFYSHLHMINRHEAQGILGEGQVQFAPTELDDALDGLLREYEDDFALRKIFFLNDKIGDKLCEEVRFAGGVVETKDWSYLFETKAKVYQRSALPPNVQVQLPAGQPMPLIPGLPRECQVEVRAQGWIHNKEPQGVTR